MAVSRRVEIHVVAVMVLCAACSDDGAVARSTSPVTSAFAASSTAPTKREAASTTVEAVSGPVSDGPVIKYSAPAPSETDFMAAEIRGVVVLDGACLYIDFADVHERYPVVWPFGTRWDPSTPAVIPPSGDPIPVGSSVSGGGGYLHRDGVATYVSADAAALADGCVDNTYGEIAIVNNFSDAIALAGT